MNSLLLKALTNEILRRENCSYPRHWFVLDEFRAMEKLDCVSDLMNRGRSKGVSVLLGIQSIEGIQTVYGQAGCDEILGQCASKTFLRLGGHATAEWAEKYFGQVRQLEDSWSVTWGPVDKSSSLNQSMQDRTLFMASFFMNLDFPEPGGVFCAVNDSPTVYKTYLAERSFEEVLSWCRQPDRRTTRAFEPRASREDQVFVPWSEDEERLFRNGPSAHQSPSLPDKNQWKKPE